MVSFDGLFKKNGANTLNFGSRNNFNPSNLVKFEIFPLIFAKVLTLYSLLITSKRNDCIIENKVSNETLDTTHHCAKDYISISHQALMLPVIKLN